MNMEEMEARLDHLEKQVSVYQDIQEIERLQKCYGYYIENWMAEEIVDLFADGPDVALHLTGLGVYQGKEKVREYYTRGDIEVSGEFLHQVMQISGIVTVSPDGKTAKGRWYGWGGLAIPVGGGVKHEYLSGIYENDYIKQDGKWKLKVVRHCPTYDADPSQGWVKPERLAAVDPNFTFEELEPDIRDTFNPRYPSGYVFPFHFNHPVTGKETSERQRNASNPNIQ